MFRRGSGDDIILDSDSTIGNTDVLVLGGGLVSTDIQLRRQGDDLVLTINDATDRLTVRNYFQLGTDANRIEQIRFSDGTVWGETEILNAGNTPTDGDDIRIGNHGDNVISGIGGNDLLLGRNGNDTLTGGIGNDTLYGGDLSAGYSYWLNWYGPTSFNSATYGGNSANGNDTYVFNRGDGHDAIIDRDISAGNIDTIALGAGILPSDVILSRVKDPYSFDRYDDLRISFASSPSDSIVVRHWFMNESAEWRVERITFADGTEWNTDYIRQTVLLGTANSDQRLGYSTDDFMPGFGGDDILRGHGGNDRIEGGDGADRLEGGEGADIVFGDAGDDQLEGGVGNDRLDGGAGRDWLFGGYGYGSNGYYGDWGSEWSWSYLRDQTNGNDTYVFGYGSGRDSIYDYDESTGNIDTVEFGPGIAPGDVQVFASGNDLYLWLNNSDYLNVSRWVADPRWRVERFTFADGTVWDEATVLQRLIQGTPGNDTIVAYGTDDSIDAFAGDDRVYGRGGADFIFGNDGNDSLYGEDGNDTLLGGGGNDFVQGGQGNDIIEGGAGTDYLNGGDGRDDLGYTTTNGNDTYRFRRGDGQDHFWDIDRTAGNLDVLEFASNISANEIVIRRNSSSSNDFILNIGVSGDQLALHDWLLGPAHYIEEIRFADGTVWDPTAVMLGSLNGTEGNDTLYGFTSDDVLLGRGGNDRLEAGAGSDVLDGGAGNDTLFGDIGNDRYLIGRGDGQDTIYDIDATVGNVDTIAYRPDVTPADVSARRVRDSLVLAIVGNSDAVSIDGWFSTDSRYRIETVEFGDGTVWDVDDIRAAVLQGTPSDDLLIGYASDDTLAGRGGNDVLAGGLGNDTYLFARNDGQDAIREDDATPGNVDTIQLAADIAPADVTLKAGGLDLFITINGTNDVLRVAGWFGDDRNKVERIVFSDGTIWDAAAIQSLANQPSDSDDTLVGTAQADVLDGAGGNDQIHGLDGDDILIGGNGDDYIEGGTGNNVMYGGDGDDTLVGGIGSDVIEGGAGNDNITTGIESAGDVMRGGAGYDNLNGSFSDDVLEGGADDDTLYAYAGNDVLDGGTGNDQLYAGQGADTLVGGAGNDFLQGDDNDDNYVVARGDGFDTVYERSDYEYDPGINAIVFGEGIRPEDLSVQVGGGTTQYYGYGGDGGYGNAAFLAIGVGNDEGAILIHEDLTGGYGGPIVAMAHVGQQFAAERFIFADGTELSVDDILARADAGVIGTQYGTGGDEFLLGSVADDEIFGSNGNERISARDHNDYVYGGFGDDVIDGGSGDDGVAGDDGNDVIAGNRKADSLYGGEGSDTYVYNRGDGQDRLDNYSSKLPGDIDSLSFGQDIRPEDIYGYVDAFGELVVLVNPGSGAAADSITARWFNDDGTGNFATDPNVVLERAQFLTETSTRIFDFTGIVAALQADLLAATAANPIPLFTSATAGFELTGTVPQAGGDHAVAYALTGDLFAVATQRFGGLGDDVINGHDGTDTIHGGDGNDIITAAGGHDVIEAGAGDDVVDAGAGNDDIDGSFGNDTLIGAAGNDTFRFNLGDGTDFVDDLATAEAGNRIVFGSGIGPNDLVLSYQDQTLIVTVGQGGDELRFSNFDRANVRGLHAVASFEFADGTILTYDQLVDRGFDLAGTETSDVFFGTNVTDRMRALGGDDVLVGGAGDDVLEGGAGHDLYAFNLGDGSDTVLDFVSLGTGNSVFFGPGIGVADLRLTTGATSLTIHYGTGGDSLRIEGFSSDSTDTSSFIIDTVRFNDGTVLSYDELLSLGIQFDGTPASEVVLGTVHADVFRAGAGNDEITGRIGDDVYLFDRGDGVDTIDDVSTPTEPNSVIFGANIASADLRLSLDASVGHLLIGIHGTNDTLRLTGFDPADPFGPHAVENFRFADGTQVSYNQLLARGFDIVATDADDLLIGSALDDRITGNAGNDRFEGGGGGDVHVGGAGDDTYTYDVGDGILNIDDLAVPGAGNVLEFGEGITLDSLTNNLSYMPPALGQSLGTFIIRVGENPGDQVHLTNFDFTDAGAGPRAVETYRFADGTSIDYQQLVESMFFIVEGDAGNDIVRGTNLNDRLYGHEGDDEMYSSTGDTVFTGGIGNDVLYGEAGNDVYVFNLGDGIDTIDDVATAAAGNFLVFGTGISQSDLQFVQDGDLLTILVGTGGDAIRLPGFNFSNVGGSAVVSTLEFADGTIAELGALVNQAPALAVAIPDQSASEGTPFSLTLPVDTFSDADIGDPLTYSARLASGASLPSWLQFDPATRAFSGTAGNGDVGTLEIEVIASDAHGQSATDRFFLAVSNTNAAPVLGVAIADQSATEDSAFAFQLPADSFVDVDAGDVLTYTAGLADGATLPSWLNFDAATRTFSGTPTNADVGGLTLRVTATDLSGASAYGDFSVTVINTNDAPAVVNPIPDQAGTVGGPFTYTVPSDAFTDVDAGDTLTYTALANGEPLPAWLSFDAATRTFSGTPADGSAGVYDIRVTATDAAGVAVWDVFVLTIAATTSGGDIVGTPDNDILYGTDGNDVIRGLAGDDYLEGREGNDTLEGGEGSDEVNGGDGDDLIEITDGEDSLYGGAGDDTFRLNTNSTGADVISGGDGLDRILGGDDSDTLMLRYFADEFTVELIDGRGGQNYIEGWQYANTLDFRNTILLGIAGIIGGPEADTIHGSQDYDELQGREGNDLLTGGGGHDDLYGQEGDDYIEGGVGNDELNGGSGADTMYGGIGDDVYYIDNAGDAVIELVDEGYDYVDVFGLSYTLPEHVEWLSLRGTDAIDGMGNSLDNTLLGNSAANTLSGLAGNDVVNGNAGDDTLIGGSGDDELWGGQGNDTYHFNAGDGQDSIIESDATAGNTDTLKFGLDPFDLIFSRRNDSLEVKIQGSGDLVSISEWYDDARHHVERFEAADNRVLLSTQVDQLIQAMAQFSADNGGITWDQAIDQRPSDVQAVLAAYWQPA